MADAPSLFQAADEPLAARMRPRTLDEFVGQGHVVGPGRLLRRAILADRLASLLLHGPPGTGKTTLARVIAGSTKAEFVALNAVLAGVKDLREQVAAAAERQRRGGRTLLFVDEVHRFNKAQQDALLPSVEAGIVTFIGATTENPYFEVNAALVSRSRVFQLVPLTEDDLRDVAHAALTDEVRGFGRLDVRLEEDALDHLVSVANGDARSLLNALELAVVTTEPDAQGAIVVDRTAAEESIQRRAVLYDKEGDAHFDVISAFIKSVRGSDPDAALYWLAKMVHAGEDPRFILRRLRILASEDVGLADPQALVHTEAAAQTYEAVGMPEGRYALAQATLYLATAPKSNSAMAFFDALAAVEREGRGDVPAHLKDAHRDGAEFGHGRGYLYPHAYRDHWVAQQYLPTALQGRLFYAPSGVGYEATIADDVARRRDAQLAAMTGGDPGEGEILSTSPWDAERDAWAERTLSGRSDLVEALRERLVEAAGLARHHRVLDLAVRSGWTTFEAMRRTPEGHVWSLPRSEAAADAIRARVADRPELERPVVAVRPEGDGTDGVPWWAAFAEGDAPPTFDRILAVGQRATVEPAVGAWLAHLAPAGRAVLLDPVPGAGGRLADAVGDALDAPRATLLAAAEAALAAPDDEDALDASVEAWTAAGGVVERREAFDVTVERRFAAPTVDGWFEADRPLPAALADAGADGTDVAAIRAALTRTLTAGVAWRSRWALVVARHGGTASG